MSDKKYVIVELRLKESEMEDYVGALHRAWTKAETKKQRDVLEAVYKAFEHSADATKKMREKELKMDMSV